MALNVGRLAPVLGVPMIAGVATGIGMHSVAVGVAAAIGTLGVVVAMAMKLTPMAAALRPGTRAWEAKMTNAVLETTIAAREQALASAPEDKRARLQREIAFLTQQVRANQMTIAANDASPGQGYIGFEPYTGE